MNHPIIADAVRAGERAGASPSPWSASGWEGRRVFLTGHTGFKGSWLSLWLAKLGAVVRGYALPPETTPSMFTLCDVAAAMESYYGDVRDAGDLQACLTAAAPDVVFHLAAQPLVRRSYADPAGTYATNVMGTAHLLDAVRATPSVRAVVIVTTDKCYENMEWDWPYREDDRLGGHDPYSSSKAAAEILTSSYRRSYFDARSALSHPALVATARAGNVIGGGDWSEDRLVPDLVRASLAGQSLRLRYPAATRPWQHVLEPLHGYLRVAERLLDGDRTAATAWNFGPAPEGERSVAWIAEEFRRQWGGGMPGWQPAEGAPVHEASRLALDWSRARTRLGWEPRWGAEATLRRTVEWYQQWASGDGSPSALRALTLAQIDDFSG